MKNRRDDDMQPSLFDLVEAHPHPPENPTRRPPFDPTKLRITEYEGEPFVLETDLGAELGYDRADNINRLIARLEKRPSWGPLHYRDAMVWIGSGARRSVRQRLLTEKQVVLTCMACKLPNCHEIQSLIADVFIAWRHGRLRAADAHIEVQLQEATDQAINQMPAFFAWAQEVAETGKAARAAKLAAERAATAAEANHANRRRDPSIETIRIGRWIVKSNHLDRCPCCQRVIIGPDYKNSHWGHMKGHSRNGVRDGWPICERCNRTWEDSKNTEDISIAFIAYLRHVEAYLAQGRLL